MAFLSSTSPPIDVTASVAAASDVNVTSAWPGGENSTGGLVAPPDGCLVIPFSVYSPWSHPEDLVSHEAQQAFNKFVNVYMLTAFFVVSVPTNLLCLLVFWRHGLRERINLCLFFLALADFLTVLGHFEWNLDSLYSEVSGAPYRLVVMKHNVNNMVHAMAGFIYISGFLSTLVALERCLCILSPLKAQHYIRTKTTAVVIALGHVVIFAGHYVIATRWRVVCMFDPLIQQTMDAFYSSQFYLDHEALVDLFDGVLFGILLPGIYVAGILVSTVVTVVKLRQLAEWRQQSSSSASAGTAPASKDVTLTRMLIGTSVLFVSCTAPPLLFHAALPFVPGLSLSGKYYNTYYLLINLQQLLTYLNASVNFFVYYLFGTKFRHSVQAIFCRARLDKAQRARKAAIDDRSTALSAVSQTFSKITEAD